jgi:hypothetical protein
MKITAFSLLLLLPACASSSGGRARPSAGEPLPPGVRISEVCGDGDPMPRLRVFGVDPMGDGLAGALVEIRQGSRIVTEGKSDREGAVLFALEATRYTVAWQLRGFVAPAPFPVRAKKGCEVHVVIQPALPPG